MKHFDMIAMTESEKKEYRKGFDASCAGRIVESEEWSYSFSAGFNDAEEIAFENAGEDDFNFDHI